MTGADIGEARSAEAVAVEKRGTTLQYCARLRGVAALIDRDPDAGIFEHQAVTGMEAAGRWVQLVANKDKIEREHLRWLRKKHGARAVDEILAEAWLALCQPTSPLLGNWFSSWFMKPAEGYALTRAAINLARKNWTNRRHRLPESLDSLCGAFVHEDAYSGQDRGKDWNDFAADTHAATVEDAADSLALSEKLAAIMETLTAEDTRVVELLVEGRPVVEVMALTGASKRKIQTMRKRVESELEEFRPAPAARRKPRQRKEVT